MLISKNLNYSKKFFGIMALVCLGFSSYSARIDFLDNDGLYLEDYVYKFDESQVDITLESKYKDADDFVGRNKNINNSGVALTIIGDSKVDATKLRKANINGKSLNPNYAVMNAILMKGNENGSPELIADNLEINIKPGENKTSLYAVGIDMNGGAKFQGKNIDINLVHSSEKKVNPVHTENTEDTIVDEDTVGIRLGNIEILDAPITSIFKADKVNINVKNTKDSDNKLFRHSLGAVDIYRNGENKSYFEVKDLNIFVKDDSKLENVEKIYGIIVEGEDTKAVVENSKIILEGKSAKLGSSAISIGYYLDDEENESTDENRNGAILESKGKMYIDTTVAPEASGIELMGNNSKLKADFENSSAEIKTGGTAISYKSLLKYFDTEENKYETMKINGNNLEIGLKDAVITSIIGNDDYSSLIHVDEDITNAVLNISGNKSKLTPGNGNLMHTRQNSNITFNLTDGALAIGKIDGGYKQGEKDGVIVLNVTNGATWRLQNTSEKSNVSKISLKKRGVLDASNMRTATNPDEWGYTLTMGNSEGIFSSDNGIITMANKSYDDRLRIYGNYIAQNNAELKINTLWNNNSSTSKSDKLVIEGEAKGETKVIAVGIDGKENIIDGDIKQVKKKIQNSPVLVDAKKADAGAFKGTAKTRGATEAQLTSAINSEGRREFFWTISALSEDSNNGPENPNNNPIGPIVNPPINNNGSSNRPTGPIIYSQVVPAYVSMEKINRDIGFTSLATLNERKGDTRLEKNDNEQAWFRILGKNGDYKGKNRFKADTNIYGVQAGYEFNVNVDKDGNKNIYGAYIAHMKTDTKFYDKYRAENGRISGDKFTGKVKTKDLNLGLTKTKYYTNGTYLDLVGQFSFINNKYQARDTEDKKQRGTALILSAELGRKYDIAENWFIEPQAQLAYQYLRLKDFNDGLRDVTYDNEGDFRGRLGVRLTTKAKRKTTFYTLANIIHDFNDKSEVRIGKDKVNEKYANTLGEVGLGLEV